MKRVLHSFFALALLSTILGLRTAVPIAAAAGLSDSLAPARGAAVQTQNGAVVHSPTVYAIYWKQVDTSIFGQTFYYEAPRCYGPGCLNSYGTDTNYENRTGTFFHDVGGSNWFGVLNQYWDADATGQQTPVFDEVTLGGTWEDNGDYPNLGRGLPAARLQPADLQAEIARAVQQNGWSVTTDSLFFIYIPVFDLQNDVHATTNTGDSVSFTFSGTGIDYISEKSDGYGLVDVYLDGALQATVDANAAGIHNLGSQILFSKSGLAAGQHTLKLVKKSGVYMLVDALEVIS